MNVVPRHSVETRAEGGGFLRLRPLAVALVAAIVVALSAVAATVASAKPVAPAVGAARAVAGAAQAVPVPCDALDELALPDVTAITAGLITSGSSDGQSNLPEFCRVALTVSPQVNIAVWLPTQATYNGRFQAVGGGGYAGTISFGAMAGALRTGYATASTDTGHSAFMQPGGSFGLNPNGTLNTQLIEDFASRSLIQLTLKAKALIAAFYGGPPAYSYWNGCSTGGRQGLMLAQRLPDGYDGILSAAPAINWDRFIPAELWPQIVMNEELGGPIAQCKLAVASTAALKACDDLDRVTDGVVDEPRRCDFDPRSLVGAQTTCGTFTEADARAIQMIWDGPRGTGGSFLWYGLAKTAPLNALAGTNPFPIATDHVRYWVEQNPAFDWRTLDYAGFEQTFRESQQLFNGVIGTDDPDLSRFRQSGGKVLMWHGWSDQLIFPEGTIDYYERVIDHFHSTQQVQRFARLFLAPGVFHCGGGTGPQVFDSFGALVQWVENGKAPDQIVASRVESGVTVRTRPLCAYPYVARYDRKDDPSSAASFDCKPNYGPLSPPNNS
jgi:pimeloyl-ACP methyl ester carboxylesterase